MTSPEIDQLTSRTPGALVYRPLQDNQFLETLRAASKPHFELFLYDSPRVGIIRVPDLPQLPRLTPTETDAVRESYLKNAPETLFEEIDVTVKGLFVHFGKLKRIRINVSDLRLAKERRQMQLALWEETGPIPSPPQPYNWLSTIGEIKNARKWEAIEKTNIVAAKLPDVLHLGKAVFNKSFYLGL